jgi:hypothetical protein
MSLTASEATLRAAERVAAVLSAQGITCAVIGGAALAFHGYIRQTLDLDLATSVQPFVVFPKILEALKSEGFEVEFRGPDSEDPLGGVLDIRREDIGPIQIVNFLNPFVGGPGALGKEAVDTATPLEGTSLHVVDLPHLIALKLYSGSLKSLSDIVELLNRHEELDLESIEALARKFDVADEWKIALAHRDSMAGKS